MEMDNLHVLQRLHHSQQYYQAGEFSFPLPWRSSSRSFECFGEAYGWTCCKKKGEASLDGGCPVSIPPDVHTPCHGPATNPWAPPCAVQGCRHWTDISWTTPSLEVTIEQWDHSDRVQEQRKHDLSSQEPHELK